ncbi:MAG: hypothetical protein WCT41_02265 [Candidatus Paceibacterota bacterium]|jgi:hypothetical protein
MANRDPVLSFGRFLREKNSFGGFFVKDPERTILGTTYLKNPAYIACLAAEPRFVALAAELRETKNVESEEYLRKLHAAYRLMHPYAEGNYQLFC